MTLYLSRMRINTRAPVRALIGLINPQQKDQTVSAHHHLIWTLFADAKERKRDFLWRYDGHERFFTLSARPPLQNELFDDFACKDFAPKLSEGDRLKFTLRAHIVKNTAPLFDTAKQKFTRGKRFDPIFEQLKELDHPKDPQHRHQIIHDGAMNWLEGQGAHAGFTPEHLSHWRYDDQHIGRPRKSGRDFRFGVSNLDGVITITDPERFMHQYAQGFGRSKAWGCGLMMIKRI